MKTLDLLCIGDPCADLVLGAERLPGWDDKAVGTMQGLFGGGTEANVACAAAHLGWRSALLGRVGADLHAEFIVRDLRGHGVRLDHLVRHGQGHSSVAVVAVSPAGERTVIWMPARGLPEIDDTRRKAAMAAARWIYTMPYAADQLPTLARQADTAGARVAIDIERESARGAGRLAQLLKHCDVALMNASGYEAAQGEPPQAAALATLCREYRARTVVVTLGAQGAMAADRDEGFARCSAVPVAEVVDTTGAGDAFNAAFLVARDRGATLTAALQQASGIAAHIVASLGARTAWFGPALAPRNTVRETQ